jgi:lipopolysaccharide transport system permease protein
MASNPAIIIEPAAAESRTGADLPVTIIKPLKGFATLQVRDLMDRLDLVVLLARRDVKARYKQTSLGWFWGVLQPLMTVLVMTFVFGHVAGLPSDGVPYALFAFAGFLPWQFFSSATNRAAASMTANGHLLKKVYLPRLAIPLSAVISAAVDAIFALAMLMTLMVWRGVSPGPKLLLAPLFLLSCGLLAWGLGSVLSAVNCRFRDVGHALPMAMQLWMYLTPVIYPLATVPSWARPVALANPMTGVITAFRWAVCGTPLDYAALIVFAAELLLILAVAAIMFSRLETDIVDYL